MTTISSSSKRTGGARQRPGGRDKKVKILLSPFPALLGLYILFGETSPDLTSFAGGGGERFAQPVARRKREFYDEGEEQRQSDTYADSQFYSSDHTHYKQQQQYHDAGTLTHEEANESPAPTPIVYEDKNFSPTAMPSHISTKVDRVEEFPRIIHYIWPGKNFSMGFDADHQLEQMELLERVNGIKALNANWTVRIWTDEECDELMRKDFADFYTIWKKKLKPKLKMWDAVRPAILHKYGGLYLDHDVRCTDIGFDNWITKTSTHTGAMLTRLLVRTKTKGTRFPLLGNSLMGSVKDHPIWLLYLSNVEKDLSSKWRSRVTRHTGPGQFWKTFRQYMNLHPDELNTTKVLQLYEYANEGECEDRMNSTLCASPRCIHEQGISPAEIAGEDDNSHSQLQASRERNRKWKGGDNNVTAVYSVPKCDPCERIQRYWKSTNGTAAFVHIPKTGGTTVEVIMLDAGGSCHATASALAACGPKKYENALSFTIIRHPVDRAISFYDYAKRGGNKMKGDVKKFAWAKNTTFDEFIAEIDPFDYNYAPMAHYINSNGTGVREVICMDDLSGGWGRLEAIEPSLRTDTNGHRVNLTATHYRYGGDHHLTLASQSTLDYLHKIYTNDFLLWKKFCGNRKAQTPLSILSNQSENNTSKE